jgi:hypothetical protein
MLSMKGSSLEGPGNVSGQMERFSALECPGPWSGIPGMRNNRHIAPNAVFVVTDRFGIRIISQEWYY